MRFHFSPIAKRIAAADMTRSAKQRNYLRLFLMGAVMSALASLTPVAKAGLIYTLEASDNVIGSFRWSVSTPGLITTTTSLQTFLLAAAPSGCTISGATINNPLGADVYIETFFNPLCDGFSEVAQGFFGAGPVSGPGTYPAGAPGWTLTVTAGPISIDPTSSTSTIAYGVNAGGQVVGSYTNASGMHGFLLSGGIFSDIDYPGAAASFVNGINDAGQIVGRYLLNGQLHGFLLAGGTFTALTALEPSGGLPQAINNAGQIVGSYNDGTGLFHGFLLSGNQVSSFTFGGNLRTWAYGINDSGTVVGIYADANSLQHGFLYDSGVFTSIDVPGASFTNATAINNAGQVVGIYGDTGGVHGFLLKAGVFTTLDFPGSNQTQPYGISRRGQIVGDYVINGIFHGFITPDSCPPAPGDVNGDGYPDMVWQDPVTGMVQVWFMGGWHAATLTGAAVVSKANTWRVVGTADFNRDGYADLIWQDPVTGMSQVWFMGGAQGRRFTGAAALSGPNAWRIVGAADFNGDGRPDLIWQDPESGRSQVWFLGGPQGVMLTGSTPLSNANTWRIVGAADFDGDGHPDLIWQDPVTGMSQVWFMGGAQGVDRLGAVILSAPNAFWIVGAADCDGDGHPDLMWQDPLSGSSQVWFMGGAQGTTVTGAAGLSGPNKWRIAVKRALSFPFAAIDVPGARETLSYGVNGENDVVGFYTDNESKGHGFVLHQGSFSSIDFPGAMFTEAFGINEEGDIVGTYIPAGGSGAFLDAQGFLLHQGTFTTIGFPGAARTQAFGINSQGDIVGFYDLPGAEPPSGPIPPPRPFHGFLLH